jgi:hypothetical protein
MPTAIYGVSRYGDPLAVYGKAATRTAMTPDNLSTLSMDPADKIALLAAITTVAGLAAKYSANIPAGDKNTYTVIGQTRAGMDEVYLRSMNDNPTLVPNFVNMADVLVDRNFRRDVKDVIAPLQRIIEGLADAETLANSDNFMAYSAYYNNVKAGAKRGVAGGDTELAKI